MSRKHFASVGVLITAGVLLTACTSGTGPAPATPPSSTENTSQQDPGSFLRQGTAKANNAKPDTGDWAVGPDGTPNTAARRVGERWVQLTAGQAGELNPVVVNGAGFTLYRFDNDEANPSKSNCAGACADTWPPVTVARGGRIFVSGVDEAAVGVVTRADGRLQVTIGGWPVYRFAKDENPGDTNGQGVGGTWFGVTPDGQKADSGDQPSPGNDQDTEKATSAILFDEPDFSDGGPSQGVSGAGCQNLARPNQTSSVRVTGSLKLWSEQNCRGDSTVIDGDVADLAALDFDDTVASVFLG